MPIKRKGSPYYHLDFQVRGIRFCSTTRCTSFREAQAIERAEREKARALTKRAPDDAARLRIDEAAVRYFEEVGKHHVCADETFTNLDRLVTCPHLKGKRLCDITDDDVTKLVAWRRGHRRWGRADLAFVSPATVNRSTTEVLEKVFNRAKEYWNARFDHEPKWKKHMLEESDERKRELRQGEGEALLDEAIRDDYEDFFDFVHATGQRAYKECLIRWPNVHWPEREIEVKGKQDRIIIYPITYEVAAILRRQIGKHKGWVFTYLAARTDPRKGLVKGQRYPITKSGAKTQWKRARRKATAACPSVANFRTHDLRHDLATKTLRKFGNLKLVQEVLNHADVKTTTRYAHVQDEEKRGALEYVQADQKSRKMSRNADRKAG